jgi:hypothetical protein
MKHCVALSGLLWFACALLPAPAQAATRAWLDRTVLAVGDTATLNVETDQAAARPDFSPLAKDFDIVDQSSSRQMSMVGGSVSMKTLFAVGLQPRHAGHIVVPPLRVGAESTQALAMDVSGASAPPPSADADADTALETVVDDANPYVQQTVGVTVRLYYTAALASGELDLDAPDGASLQRIGDDAQSVRDRGGRRYNVVERHYLLVPERSGPLNLPGARFRGRGVGNWVDDFFGNGTREIRAYGAPRMLQVRAQPANAPQPWLPLHGLRLRYVSAPQRVRAGEAATLTVEAVAEGATRAQLPDLPVPSAPGAQVFAEPVQYDENFVDGVPQVKMTRRYSIVPDGSGTLHLPGLRMGWWDVRAGEAKNASLPDLDIEVMPGAGGFANRQLPASPAATAAAAAPSADTSLQLGSPNAWMWLAVAFAVLWLLTLIWAVWRRREPVPAQAAAAPQAPAGAPRRAMRGSADPGSRPGQALKKALDTGTLDEIGETLCAMATPPVADLDALLARLDDPAQRNAIEALRRARWADGDGTAARNALRAAFKGGPKWRAAAIEEKEILPPLYPK